VLTFDLPYSLAGTVLRLDYIVLCQYSVPHVKRQTDPDVLLLQAAADPARLSMLRMLSGDGVVCACDFTSCCDLSQPTISHHLKVLREAGWVDYERRGTWLYYRLRPEAVARFRQLAGEIERPAAPIPADATPRRLPVIQPLA
jgi:ArsR family transcriptional regulator